MHFCKAHARTLRLNTRCYELTPGPSSTMIVEFNISNFRTFPELKGQKISKSETILNG